TARPTTSGPSSGRATTRRSAEAREHARRPSAMEGRSSEPSWRRLLLLALADLGEHVARAEDQEVLAVDGDLGAAVLRVDEGVALGQVDRDELAAVLGAPARAHREDLALLGLLLGGVGD